MIHIRPRGGERCTKHSRLPLGYPDLGARACHAILALLTSPLLSQPGYRGYVALTRGFVATQQEIICFVVWWPKWKTTHIRLKSLLEGFQRHTSWDGTNGRAKSTDLLRVWDALGPYRRDIKSSLSQTKCRVMTKTAPVPFHRHKYSLPSFRSSCHVKCFECGDIIWPELGKHPLVEKTHTQQGQLKIS